MGQIRFQSASSPVLPIQDPQRLPQLGLTLPELLISVVIVGLLSAIALPNYMNSIKATRQKDVANQIANIQTSIAAYREEFLANPAGWKDLWRIAPVNTNKDPSQNPPPKDISKEESFTPIQSANGGAYTISTQNSGNIFILIGTPNEKGSALWDIKACLNTQTGLSDIQLGNPSKTVATPVCT